MLGGNAANLGLYEKKQIIIEYRDNGGLDQLMKEDPNEQSYVIHNGKRYDRVQIEEDNNEYLMDEEGNLYNLEFEFIG